MCHALPLQVHTCGWRAMLALLVGSPDPEPASASAGEGGGGRPAAAAAQPAAAARGESIEVPPELVALLWHAMRVHARRAAVQAVCCELLAALLAEDCRRAALRRADLQVLPDARDARHALQQVCAMSASHVTLRVHQSVCIVRAFVYYSGGRAPRL